MTRDQRKAPTTSHRPVPTQVQRFRAVVGWRSVDPHRHPSYRMESSIRPTPRVPCHHDRELPEAAPRSQTARHPYHATAPTANGFGSGRWSSAVERHPLSFHGVTESLSC